MQNEKCPNDSHEWLCKRIHGDAGEKTDYRKLSAGQVENVRVDPTRSEEVCPGGIIICGRCQNPLFEDQQQPDLMGEFLGRLNEKLVTG